MLEMSLDKEIFFVLMGIFTVLGLGGRMGWRALP